MTLTAAQCSKTLITASLAPASNPALKHCAGLLLPPLIGLVAAGATRMDDSEKLAVILPSLEEALKTFTLFYSGVQEVFRKCFPFICTRADHTLGQGALGVILPTLALLLDPSRTSPSPVHAQSISIILGFATSSPGPFKDVVDNLDNASREVIETSIRQALSARQQATTSHVASKPQISLKAF